MPTPLYPKDQGTEWMNLKRQVKDAFTSANSRVPYAKIGAGIVRVFTSLVIEAGAYLAARYENGAYGLFFGTFSLSGIDHQGFVIFNPEGSTAFQTYYRNSDAYGFTAVWDRSNNIVLSDDGDSGKGLGRPWIPHTFVDTSEIANPPAARQTSGTTDVSVVTIFSPVQHSKLHFQAYVTIAVGGSTAEVKFKDISNGLTLYTGTSGGGYISSDFSIGDYTFGDEHQIDITIRRASGSGAVGLTLLACHGRQS